MVPAGHGRTWLTVPEPPDRRLAPILLLQTLYPLFARTAEALGRDPDRPRTLTKVTETR
jgi:fructoselysine-6-P-deglycase FrlB-like protein